MSSTSVTVIPSVCFNEGYFVDGSCNCPSGFGGSYCTQKFGKSYFLFFNVYYSFTFVKILNYVTELFVKIMEFVLFEVQKDLMNLFVFVFMVHQVIIVN